MPINFLDTNVILRLLLKDVPEQYQKAFDIFNQAIDRELKIIANDLVFFEVYWVLKSKTYSYDKSRGIS